MLKRHRWVFLTFSALTVLLACQIITSVTYAQEKYITAKDAASQVGEVQTMCGIKEEIMHCSAGSPKNFDTKWLSEKYDYLAPDGSEIRLLVDGANGGLCHCTLPAGKVSAAVHHKSVEEVWYCLAGEGEVWRRQNEREETVAVRAGASLSIPPGTSFQFRNNGLGPLCFIITTMPPWPGPQESVPSQGKW